MTQEYICNIATTLPGAVAQTLPFLQMKSHFTINMINDYLEKDDKFFITTHFTILPKGEMTLIPGYVKCSKWHDCL